MIIVSLMSVTRVIIAIIMKARDGRVSPATDVKTALAVANLETYELFLSRVSECKDGYGRKMGRVNV